MVCFGFFVYPARRVEAGLLSQLLRFFTGFEKEESQSAAASLSFPLLGSQITPPLEESGGPLPRDAEFDLPATQDSALIASRNPIGTLNSPAQDQILIYKVKEGDTPASIAENFGISLNTLLWANSIRNPRLIRIGDELIILPVTGVQYEVRKGDTIESIAKQFKGDAEEIISFNGLVIDEPLMVGTALIIPDGEIVLPPSPTVRIPRFSGLPEYKGYYLRPIFGGRRSRGIHGFNGIDLANSCGVPVLAAAEGTVLIARSSGWNGGYGRYIVLNHSNGTQTLYAHLLSVLASPGQKVAQGSQIAVLGSSGNSTGCHAHFEVRGAKNPF